MKTIYFRTGILACPVCQRILDVEKLSNKYICECGSMYQSEHDIPVLIPLNKNTGWIAECRRDKLIMDKFYIKRLEKVDEWWIPYNKYRKLLLEHDFQICRKLVVNYILSSYHTHTPICILDAGGGDGWFLDILLRNYPLAKGWNTELSSVIVAVGLKRYKNERMYECVGSITHLPSPNEFLIL